MNITKEQLQQITNNKIKSDKVDLYLPHLNKYMSTYGIDTKLRICAFFDWNTSHNYWSSNESYSGAPDYVPFEAHYLSSNARLSYPKTGNSTFVVRAIRAF